MEILNFILIIYLLMQVSSLKKRVQKEPQLLDQAAAQPIQNSAVKEKSHIISPVSSESDNINAILRLITWLREDWMLKLGGFFILLAVGWFISYAFMNNWIGEMGRIVFGILSGCCFMTWGTLRMKKVLREGETLLIIGAIILVTSIFAGQHLYHLYPEAVALLLMSFVALVIATIAYINKREVLAVCGVLMIGISPVLAGYDSVTPNVSGLLTYLFCMTLGVIWLSKVTSWRSITFLSTIVVFAYVAPYFIQYHEYLLYGGLSQPFAIDIDVLRFFAVIFSILFNMSAFFTLLFGKKITRDDFSLVATAAGFIAFSLFTLSTPDLLALKLAAVAILYMILAVILTKIKNYSYYVELYATVSILFLIVATVKTAHLDMLPTVFSVEAIVLTIFYRFAFGAPYPIAAVFLYGGSFLISWFNISEVGTTWQATVGFVATLISTYFPYLLAQRDKSMGKTNAHSNISTISIVAGNILASVGFYTCVENIGTIMKYDSSLIKGIQYSAYAIVGSFLYFTSRSMHHGVRYFFGIGFIIYVVAALLLYEVWMMDITARIVIFFLIGLLFISSIYFLKLYEKKS